MMMKFDEEMIKLGISLEKDSKTALFFSSILAAYEGEEVSIKDSLVKFAFNSQKEKITKFLEEKKRVSELRKNAGSIGAKERWHTDTKQKTLFDDKEEVFETDTKERYSFDDFYNLYNNKKGKQAAIKAWNRLTKKEKTLAMENVPKYLAYIEYKRTHETWSTKTEFQMHPATYLNGKRWEDDYSITENNAAYGTDRNNYKSIKEQEFERNVAVLKDTMARAERGEYADLDPFNAPAKEYWEIQRDMANGGTT